MGITLYNPTANKADFEAWLRVQKTRAARRHIRKTYRTARIIYSKRVGNHLVLSMLRLSADMSLATARAIMVTHAINRAHTVTIGPHSSSEVPRDLVERIAQAINTKEAA